MNETTPRTVAGMREVAYLFTDLRGSLMQLSRLISERDYNLEALPRVTLSGSGVPGWQSLNDSELYISPDASWSCEDPFAPSRSLVFAQPEHPDHKEGYTRDPRAVAQRVEQWASDTGLADDIFIGPELEFHLFKGVRYATTATENYSLIDEIDGHANNAQSFSNGHRIGHHTQHLALSPIDRFVDLRRKIAKALLHVGVTPVHHLHEAGRSQQEIGVMHRKLVRAADEVQLQKYVIRNIAEEAALTATFMPKPMAYSVGNGMHVNISLWKGGKNIFFQGPGKLSELAFHFMGGILAHVKSLNLITNPTTNSYRRLCHVYSPFVDVGFGERDRTAAIRVPRFDTEADCRLEVRFPDPSANPYLAFSALICAGADGIASKLEPARARMPVVDPRPYRFGEGRPNNKTMARTLYDAMNALVDDTDYLRLKGVFPEDLLWALVKDAAFFSEWNDTTPTPLEYQYVFSV